MTTREEIIGDARLILGDCRDVLPLLSGIDAVVTDPPFEIIAAGGGMGARRKYLADIVGHLDGGFDSKLLRGFSNWLVFCGKSQIVGLNGAAESADLRWQILTWNKTNPTPLTNGNYLPDTEYMIHAFQKHCWDSKSRFVIGPVEKNNIPHPTVKPLYVMSKAVQSASSFSQTILDPFMSSGTTGVACARLGRKFTGIEVHEPYFDIAVRRITEAYRQADLFVPRPVAEKAASEPSLFPGA